MMNALMIFLALVSSCFQDERWEEQLVTDDSILIVYLSRTQNTKTVAELIREKVGGTLVALELQKPYPEDYDAIVQQVAKENESGYLPLLKTKFDMVQYDTVFVGFPTWGMQLPPPIKSFLNEHDLKDKVVIPFNTHAGYGVGSGIRSIKKLCPNSTVLEGFSIKGGIERDGIYLTIEGERKIEVEQQVIAWLNALHISPINK